jgi:hypothetical protein
MSHELQMRVSAAVKQAEKAAGKAREAASKGESLLRLLIQQLKRW